MKTIYFLIVVALIGFPYQALADFYRYVDKNGVRRFTDNLSEVPEDQRPKVHRYSEQEASKPEAPAEKPSKSVPKSTDDAAKQKEPEISEYNTQTVELSQSKDVLTGEIIEMSQNKEFIQVGNYIIRVGTILLDNGKVGPVLGTSSYLSEGRLVKVFIEKRGRDFWEAEQVLVFLGKKREEVLRKRR